jgi:aryl-alcohol dehydrogenase-like predicted oxidoreductase
MVFMDPRRLGRTELEITPIGLGCMQFSGPGRGARMAMRPLEQDAVSGVVRAALDAGISWFDTAEMYGNGHSERALTTALAVAGVRPGQTTIATKWVPFARTAGNLTRTIDVRLECLQGFAIDLYQIHLPYLSLSGIPAQMRAMAGLVRAGRIRAVGVSNFSARQLEVAHRALAAEGIPLASNQVRINLLHRAIETNGVLAAARRLGVTLIAHSPLEGGILTGRFHRDPSLVAKLPPIRRLGRHGYLRPRGLARCTGLIDELQVIADAQGATAAQVALSWLVTNYGDTVVAIPGASSPRQATEAGAAPGVTLGEKELARLNELSPH